MTPQIKQEIIDLFSENQGFTKAVFDWNNMVHPDYNGHRVHVSFDEFPDYVNFSYQNNHQTEIQHFAKPVYISTKAEDVLDALNRKLDESNFASSEDREASYKIALYSYVSDSGFTYFRCADINVIKENMIGRDKSLKIIKTFDSLDTAYEYLEANIRSLYPTVSKARPVGDSIFYNAANLEECLAGIFDYSLMAGYKLNPFGAVESGAMPTTFPCCFCLRWEYNDDVFHIICANGFEMVATG